MIVSPRGQTGRPPLYDFVNGKKRRFPPCCREERCSLLRGLLLIPRVSEQEDACPLTPRPSFLPLRSRVAYASFHRVRFAVLKQAAAGQRPLSYARAKAGKVGARGDLQLLAGHHSSCSYELLQTHKHTHTHANAHRNTKMSDVVLMFP